MPNAHLGSVEPLEPRLLMSSAFPNVNVSRAVENHAEGAIAVDPTDPAHLFAASNAPGTGLFVATSGDGGATWATRTIASGGEDRLPLACCDPTAAFDAFGNLFLAHAREGEEGEAGVDLLLSADRGRSFTLIETFEGELDQPTVTTGPGSVWLTFEQDGTVGAAGAAVTGLATVGAFGNVETLPRSRGGNFGDVAVGPAGQVLVAYQAGPRLVVHLDRDGLGPASFGRGVLLGTTRVGTFESIAAQRERTIDAEVAVAFDRSGGPFDGRAYALYTDELPANSDNTDLLLRYSNDNGGAWSAPARVNSDTTLASQFLPRMAVDQTSGDVGIGWYDAREDTGTAGSTDTNDVPNDDVRYFAAIARPAAGGMLIGADAAVSAGASNAEAADSTVDLGDYTGLDFRAGVLRPLWADNSNSTGANPDGRLGALDQYTAAVRADALPPPTRFAPGALPGEFRPVLFTGKGVAGRGPFRFRVTYADAAGIAAASLDDGDLTVSGPGALRAPAQLLRARPDRAGTVTATYAVNPPEGAWSEADNGTHTVNLLDGAVTDAAGNPKPGGELGTFVVRGRRRPRG